MYYIDDYEKYLESKGTAAGTRTAYLSDIEDFEIFFASSGRPLEKAKEEDFKEYLDKLAVSGKSKATVNRRISSIRSFYDYLIQRGAVKVNPCRNSKAEKVEEKEIVYLSEEKINQLIESPSDDAAGLRDRALLEMMYATGMKVSELCGLDIWDLNLNIGYVSVNTKDKSKARVVPIGKYCRNAVKEYMLKGRRILLGKKEDRGALFVSHVGERITRQGVWKIIKTYADRLGFEEEITPQVIRNTFAVHLIQHGADLKSLQEILGHEDIIATKIYLKFRKNRVLDVYNNTFPRA